MEIIRTIPKNLVPSSLLKIIPARIHKKINREKKTSLLKTNPIVERKATGKNLQGNKKKEVGLRGNNRILLKHSRLIASSKANLEKNKSRHKIILDEIRATIVLRRTVQVATPMPIPILLKMDPTRIRTRELDRQKMTPIEPRMN